MLWFKKVPTYAQSGLFNGFTDWHSHILPGVDDGIKTLQESLATLESYEQLGVKELWLTPHIMEECPNTTEGLKEKFEEFRNEYQGSIELHLAAENMLDALFDERIRKEDLLPIGKEQKHLLVETSYVNPPIGMEQMVQCVFASGLTPVLAHPERYRYMDKDDYREWKDKGVLFQCNLMSLVGMYGETARSKCEWLLKEGLVDLTGSDLHRHAVLEHVLDKRPKSKDALTILTDIAHSPAIK